MRPSSISTSIICLSALTGKPNVPIGTLCAYSRGADELAAAVRNAQEEPVAIKNPDSRQD
jgi:hypothetical protein